VFIIIAVGENALINKTVVFDEEIYSNSKFFPHLSAILELRALFDDYLSLNSGPSL